MRAGLRSNDRLHLLARYLASGAVVFAVNMGLAAAAFAFEWPHRSDLHTNVTNAIVTEIAFVFSFFVHYLFTWRESRGEMWVRLARFHMVAAGSLTLRFTAFAILIWLNVHVLIATAASIGLQMILNFLGFDSFVFRLAESHGPAHQDAVYAEDGTGVQVLETLEEARRYNRYVVRQLAPAFGEENLELGAGQGTISAIVAEDRAVRLCELSAANLKALKARFKGHVNVREIREDFFSYKKPIFDCIYSSNVMEHIEDDTAILAHADRILKPGGRFVAFVPAGPWLYSDFDRKIGHLRRYSGRDRRRFEAFIAERGLKLRFTRFRYLNLPGAFAWFIKMRLLSAPGIRRQDAMLADALINWFALFDGLRPPLGQSLVFELQKER